MVFFHFSIETRILAQIGVPGKKSANPFTSREAKGPKPSDLKMVV